MFTLLSFSVFSWGILVIAGTANLPVLAIFYVYFVKGASNLSIPSNLYVFCVGEGDDNFSIIAIFDVFLVGGGGAANLSITDIFFVFFVVGGEGAA